MERGETSMSRDLDTSRLSQISGSEQVTKSEAMHFAKDYERRMHAQLQRIERQFNQQVKNVKVLAYDEAYQYVKE